MPVKIAAAGAVMLAASMVMAGPAAADPADVVVTYSIHQDGDVRTDLGRFARKVKATLNHPRGWSLDGHIDFRRVESDAQMRLVLASPAAVENAAPGCSAAWSCRVGERVLINDRRWRNASDSWGLSIRAYQHYVVNHEVGHFLGLGHRHCPEPGAPAPVMQQQSIDKEGCQSNVWPRLSELQAAARNQGVPVPDRSPRPASDSRGEAPGTASTGKPSQQSRQSQQGRSSGSGQQPSTRTPAPTPVQAEATASSTGPVGPASTPSSTAAPAQTSTLQSARQALPVILLSVLAILVVAGVVGGTATSLARRRRG